MSVGSALLAVFDAVESAFDTVATHAAPYAAKVAALVLPGSTVLWIGTHQGPALAFLHGQVVPFVHHHPWVVVVAYLVALFALSRIPGRLAFVLWLLLRIPWHAALWGWRLLPWWVRFLGIFCVVYAVSPAAAGGVWSLQLLVLFVFAGRFFAQMAMRRLMRGR